MESAMLITQKLFKSQMLKNVVFVLLLIKVCFLFGQKKIVMIDPGHGGRDTGAIGANNLQEKDVVLQVTKEIVQLNSTLLNDEFDIYLTRYKDTLISLSDRSRLAKALKPDVFISLHCNHSGNPTTRGIEVYVHNSKKPNTKKFIGLGLSILNEATDKLGFDKRGVKFANFQVLIDVSNYAAVLVEMGFMSNPDEADHFLKSKNIRALALTILMGIVNFPNVKL